MCNFEKKRSRFFRAIKERRFPKNNGERRRRPTRSWKKVDVEKMREEEEEKLTSTYLRF